MRRVGAVGRAHLSPPISAAGKLRKAIHCPPARALSRRSSRRTRRTPCPIPRSRRPCPRVSARRLFRRRPPWPSRINGTGVNQRSGASFNEGTFLQSGHVDGWYCGGELCSLARGLHQYRSLLPGDTRCRRQCQRLPQPDGGQLRRAGRTRDNHHQEFQWTTGGLARFLHHDCRLRVQQFLAVLFVRLRNRTDDAQCANSQEDFSLTGTDLFGLTNIKSGMGFSVDASLTLVSDPGSLIQLSSLSDVSGPLPNIGAFAGSAVPEPLSFVELGTHWPADAGRRVGLAKRSDQNPTAPVSDSTTWGSPTARCFSRRSPRDPTSVRTVPCSRGRASR